MEKKTQHTLFLIAFGVVLYAALMNLSSVLLFLRKIGGLLLPVILGLLFAFILNVPMKGFEKIITRIFSKSKHRPKGQLLCGISLVLTLASIGLVITLASTMVIPALVTSVKSVYPLMKEKFPEWAIYLDSHNIDVSRISAWLTTFDIKQISSGAGVLVGSAVDMATSTLSGITNIVFAMVIAIYTLLSKNTLSFQVKKLAYAHLKESVADKLCHISVLVRDTYSKFLSGQCIEAIILGCLIFIAYSLFRLPYAGLIGVLTGLFAFVPYIGALGSCLIGAFLTLLAAPSQVFLCIIVYLVVQFIENQFIYPNVVGSSVGLSPFWTLIAALIGGKIFGLPGIIFCIPLVAVLYVLVGENTNRKLEEKGYELKMEQVDPK